MSDDINTVLRYRPAVQKSLAAFIRQQERSAGGLAWNRDVAKRLEAFATGGKLLRGCLVCYSYALESEAPPTEAVLRTVVALELMHTALLIHDDLIDRDDTRRGQPAMHRQYSQLADKQHLSDPERFGYNLALCAGDTALFWALGLLSASPDIATNTAISELFSRVLAAVCGGQMADVHRGLAPNRPSKATIYSIMQAKTATYTVALPLAAGAVLAERPADVQQGLYAAGLAAGTIFQIRDDELGLFGDSGSLGKPVGSDIREGKKTLPYYYLWQAAAAGDRRYFSTVFGNPAASSADITAVQEALRSYGVPQRLKRDIDRLSRQAGRHIAELDISDTSRAKLRQLVSFCAARQT